MFVDLYCTVADILIINESMKEFGLVLFSNIVLLVYKRNKVFFSTNLPVEIAKRRIAGNSNEPEINGKLVTLK